MIRCKISQQNNNKWNLKVSKNIIPNDKVGFIPGIKYCFNIWKSTNVVIYNMQKLKKKFSQYMHKNPVTNSIPIHDKNFQQTVNRRKLSWPNRRKSWKTYILISYLMVNDWMLSTLSSTRQKVSTLTTSMYHAQKVLAKAINQEKTIKVTELERKM